MGEFELHDSTKAVARLALALPLFVPANQENVNITNGSTTDEQTHSCDNQELDETLRSIGSKFRIPIDREQEFDNHLSFLLMCLADENNTFSAFPQDNEYFFKIYRFLNELTSSSVPEIIRHIDTIIEMIHAHNLTVPIFDKHVIIQEEERYYALLAFMTIIRASQTTHFLNDTEQGERTARLRNCFNTFAMNLNSDNSLQGKFRLPPNPTYAELELLNTICTLLVPLFPQDECLQESPAASHNLIPFRRLKLKWREALIQHDIVDSASPYQDLHSKQITNTQIVEVIDTLVRENQIQSIDLTTSYWIILFTISRVSRGEEYLFSNEPRHKNILFRHLQFIKFDLLPILQVSNKTPLQLISALRRLFLSVSLDYESMLKYVDQGRMQFHNTE